MTYSNRICPRTFYLFVLLGLIALGCGQKKESIPYWVMDEAHILTNEEIGRLNGQIADLEQDIGSQIGILTIESLGGEKIEAYSLRMANQWGIGRKDYDDGILITFAKQERQVRIEVGLGLEKIIKDEIAARIIRQEMAPEFRNGNYFNGLHRAVDKMKALIRANEELVGQR